MNRTSTAPIIPPAVHPLPPKPKPAARLALVPDRTRTAAAEQRRWLLALGIPFTVSAAFFAAAIGTGLQWLIGPALVLGPGLIILAFVYLGLTSDTEGSAPVEGP